MRFFAARRNPYFLLFTFALTQNLMAQNPTALELGKTQSKDAKVSYGPDNRKNPQEVVNPLFLRLARSTAVMVNKNKIRFDSKGPSVGIESKTLQSHPYQLCPDEKFTTEPAVGHCSGFLVAPNRIVTAGHCVPSFEECRSFAWVFDYRADQLGISQYSVRRENVYNCKRVITQALDNRFASNKRDFGVIELDRDVTDRSPVEVRRSGDVKVGDKLVVIGYPSGLPVKIADDAQVRVADHKDFFKADLDTFGGNSGSAVFNAETGVVEGILVRGARDYVYDPIRQCRRVNYCVYGQFDCKGEDVSKIQSLPTSLWKGRTEKKR